MWETDLFFHYYYIKKKKSEKKTTYRPNQISTGASGARWSYPWIRHSHCFYLVFYFLGILHYYHFLLICIKEFIDCFLLFLKCLWEHWKAQYKSDVLLLLLLLLSHFDDPNFKSPVFLLCGFKPLLLAFRYLFGEEVSGTAYVVFGLQEDGQKKKQSFPSSLQRISVSTYYNSVCQFTSCIAFHCIVTFLSADIKYSWCSEWSQTEQYLQLFAYCSTVPLYCV